MESRDRSLKKLRPELPNIRLDGAMSTEESFQNITLRPIVKLQNDLLVAIFKNYIVIRKSVFYNLKIDQKMEYIDNSIAKDSKLRNSLRGIIVGHFTLEEYEHYILNSSALNKRITNLLKERIKSNIQLLELKRETQLI